MTVREKKSPEKKDTLQKAKVAEKECKTHNKDNGNNQTDGGGSNKNGRQDKNEMLVKDVIS